MKTIKDKLSIAMIGHKRIPSREGGVEIVVEELSTRMVRQGHKVTCFNRKGHHVSGKEYTVNSLKRYKDVVIKEVPTLDVKGLAAITSSIMGAICATFGKYDVVHFHAEGPAFMCWLPKLFGKRVIVTIHGLDWQRAKWGKLASTYIMAGEKAAVKYADEIIVLSESVKAYFNDTYHRETKFIPNGVNSQQIKAANLIYKYGIEKDEYILFLGRLVPEKGLRYLIEAFKKVKTEKKLVIAGGASDTDEFMRELKSMAEYDNRIIFTDFVQGELLEELYSNAYIYVLPSDLEGMPLSLLEAMSYGNCCLVSDISECAEVVEDKGILFKKGNIEDLIIKLQLLCDEKNIVQNYKVRASEFICDKYSWDDVVTRTVDLYY